MALSTGLHFATGTAEIYEELAKAKALAPDDSVGLAAFQMAFAQWLQGFLPAPVGAVAMATSAVADATITDPAFRAAQQRQYTEELVGGVHRILKKHNLQFREDRDLQIVFGDHVGVVPKDVLRDFNAIQKFVTSAELVFKELTSPDVGDLFREIGAKSAEFHAHSDNVQNVRVDFVVEPESHLGKVVQEFESQRAANEKLYKTPRKETTMSTVTSSFTTHDRYATPSVSVSGGGGGGGGGGGKINFTILIPVFVCTIPLGGGAGGLCVVQ